MLNTKVLAPHIALAGALPLLVASSAFAQYGSYPGTYRTANRGYANRTVEGTVASVAVARNGEHVRLTNGMDVVVPQFNHQQLSEPPLSGRDASAWRRRAPERLQP